MAIVHAALTIVRGRADTGATLPLSHAIPRGGVEIVTGAESQATGTPARDGEVCFLTVEGGSIYCKFGTDAPDAAVEDGTRYRLLPGVYAFDVDAGHVLAVVSA